MTNISDPAALDDNRRKREILRRTRMGLLEDLDDLRDELVDHLEDFETRLKRTARHLPRWLDLPDNSLRGTFELPTPQSLKGTLIGPRTIAMVAARVEEFLGKWLGDGDEIQAWIKREDEKAVEQLSDDLTALEAAIDAAYNAVTALADDGPFELEQILESIVFELETRRETDVEALESLVQGGDVDAGRDAQAEIAELWEEQRRRAGQLQRVWDDILALHHEGISRTLSGLEELQELAQRARDGVEGAGIFPEKVSEEKETVDSEPSAPSSPLPEIETEKVGLSAGSSSSNPFLRGPSEAEIVDTPDAPSDSEESGQTQLSLIDEPGPTLPMIGNPTAEVDDSDVSEDMDENADPTPEKPEVPEISEPADEPSETLPETVLETAPMISQETEEFTEAADPESTPVEAVETEVDCEADAAYEEKVDFQVDIAEAEEPQPEEDRLRVRSFRIRTGWQVVTPGEIAVALGPAGLFVAVFFVLSLLSVVGVVENPMVTWDWAFRATLAAIGLLMVLPLMMGWRPMWRGHRFKVLRRGEVEDEVDLRLTETRLYFDRTSWLLGELRDLSLAKWESPDDDTQGWLLTIDPPYQTAFDLATFEASPIAWNKSSAPTIAPPSDAWQLPPEEFEIIHDTIRQALSAPPSR